MKVNGLVINSPPLYGAWTETKPSGSDHIPPHVIRGIAGMVLHVERQFTLARLHDAARGVIGSRRPVLQIFSRSNERLHERALEVVTTAR